MAALVLPAGWTDAKYGLLAFAFVGELVQGEEEQEKKAMLVKEKDAMKTAVSMEKRPSRPRLSLTSFPFPSQPTPPSPSHSGGLIFGWNALALMLKAQGVYAEGCPADPATTGAPSPSSSTGCPSQENRLAVLWTVGVFALNAGPVLVGPLLDALGPKLTAVLGTLLNVAALLLLAFFGGSGAALPAGVLPAASVLLGLGGMTFHLAQFHISNLFPLRRGLVSSLLVSGFTGCGVVFYFVELAWSAAVAKGGHDPAAAFRVALGAYSGLVALWLPLLLWIAPWHALKVGQVFVAAGRGRWAVVQRRDYERSFVRRPQAAAAGTGGGGTAAAAAAAPAPGGSIALSALDGGSPKSRAAAAAAASAAASAAAAGAAPVPSPLRPISTTATTEAASTSSDPASSSDPNNNNPVSPAGAPSPGPLSGEAALAYMGLRSNAVPTGAAATTTIGGFDGGGGGESDRGGLFFNGGGGGAGAGGAGAGALTLDSADPRWADLDSPTAASAALRGGGGAGNAGPSSSSSGQNQNNNNNSDVAFGPLTFEARRFVELREKRFWAQFVSAESTGMGVFYTLNVFCIQFYLGTARLQLAAKGDSPATTGLAFTKLASVLPLFGFLGIPAIGWLLDSQGYGATLGAINLMGVAASLMQAVPSLRFQALTITVWTYGRFFLYTSYFTIFGALFGFRNFGRMVAIDNTVNGLFGLLQLPLTSWGLRGLRGDFTAINLLQAAVLLPLFGFCWAMRRWEGGDLVPIRAAEGEALPVNVLGPRVAREARFLATLEKRLAGFVG